jgi:hypothetical protein
MTEEYLVDFLHTASSPLPVLNLVDVGVSGGIAPVWRRWGDRLCGVGVDALTEEIARLAAAETNPNFRYEAARIVGPTRPGPAPSNYPLHRAQCYLATRILMERAPAGAEAFIDLWRDTIASDAVPTEANYSNISNPMTDPFYRYYAERFGGSNLPPVTDRTATLDALLDGFPADVLKIDTDGYDFDVLRGATQTLPGCLAVDIEVQFHGPVSSDANVFCNIDLFLRERGFTLLKLEPIRYSRAALPQAFLYDIPAQTARGPVQWADAFYARDLLNAATAPDQLRNLATILDAYGLEDMAAEIILGYPQLFDPGALDFLARKVHGSTATYRGIVDRFMRGPVTFGR